MWVIRGVLTLMGVIFDIDLVDGGPPPWLDLTVYTLAGVWLASGLVWLAGALVAGSRTTLPGGRSLLAWAIYRSRTRIQTRSRVNKR